MARWNEVGKIATSVRTFDGVTEVVYHSTIVVAFDANRIVLNSDGWRTHTTKTRMNQASKQYDLGFQVYQDKKTWYVVLRTNGEWDWAHPIPFTDGMIFKRNGTDLELLPLD